MIQSTVHSSIALEAGSQQFTVNGIKSAALSLLSGIVLALPFCSGRLWVFGWCGFVPLFFALHHKTPLKAFLLSYFTGLVFWSVTIYWLIHVTLLGQILLIAYLALYFGIFGFIITKLWTVDYGLWTIFSLPSAWVCLEYLRAHLLTGFGWALLGYSQYLNPPVIQIADLVGVYGVSFLVMMVNIALCVLPALPAGRRRAYCAKKKNYIVLPIMCLLAALGYGYFRLTTHDSLRTTVKVSLIQGNIPQELKWAFGSQPLILDRYAQLTKDVALEKPAIIIWPEASSPGFWGEPQDAWILETIFSLAKEARIPLLFGTVVKEKGQYFNSALLINEEGKLSGRYDKLHLVPFGEYVPLKHIFKFLATIVPIGDFTAGKEFTTFSLNAIRDTHPSATLRASNAQRFGVLICFEDTIPELSRNFVRKGADLLVNITNDAWFKKTSAPYQHLSASVFRAIENRVALVRAANTGVSCVIDPQGKIIARVLQGQKDTFVPGIMTANIHLRQRNSLYCTIGDSFVFGCLALVGFCGIIKKL